MGLKPEQWTPYFCISRCFKEEIMKLHFVAGEQLLEEEPTIQAIIKRAMGRR